MARVLNPWINTAWIASHVEKTPPFRSCIGFMFFRSSNAELRRRPPVSLPSLLVPPCGHGVSSSAGAVAAGTRVFSGGEEPEPVGTLKRWDVGVAGPNQRFINWTKSIRICRTLGANPKETITLGHEPRVVTEVYIYIYYNSVMPTWQRSLPCFMAHCGQYGEK